MEGVERYTQKIRGHFHELQSVYRVKRIGVFGSVARGEQTASSDIDMLVEFSEPVGFFEFVRLEAHLSGLLGRRVDLVTKKALKPRIRERILDEAVYA